MEKFILEIRPIGRNKTLVTCPNGKKIIALSKPCDLLSEISKSNLEDLDHSHAFLKALIKNGCLKSMSGTSTSSDVIKKAQNTRARIVVCGDPDIGRALSEKLLQFGHKASFSNLSARECSYGLTAEDFLIISRTHESETAFADSLRMLDDQQATWIPISNFDCLFTVGPVSQNGKYASFDDLLRRRRANSQDIEIADALSQMPLNDDFLSYLKTKEAALNQLAIVLSELIAYDLDDCGQSRHNTVWHIDDCGNMTVHPVLPCQFNQRNAETKAIHTPSFLIDEYYGLIKSLSWVKHSEKMPKTLRTIQARTTDLRRMSPYVNTVFCQGSGIIPHNNSSNEAQLLGDLHLSAIGESAERYCSNLVDLLPVFFGSYEEMKRRGYPVLDPHDIILFSDWQYSQKGFPFTKFDRELPVHWVEGHYVDDGAPCFVPASLVFVNWHVQHNRSAPKINFPAFAGVAAGLSRDLAILSGISEIIERHATMVWWLNRHPLPHLKLTKDQIDLFITREQSLRPALINLDNVFHVPVAAGIVHNDSSHMVHIGFSARANIKDAALKAWSEALTLQEGAHDLLDPHGSHWTAINDGLIPGRSYKRWRDDRKYLDDFRSDLRDVDDLLVQQEFYLDPRAVHLVSDILDSDPVKEQATVPTLIGDPLQKMLESIHSRGLRAIAIDITSHDVASCGLHVVRTLIPGTVGNTPAAFPYLGRGIVHSEAIELGWRSTPLQDHEVNKLPLPHA